MQVQWLLMAALLLPVANLPKGDSEKPKDLPKGDRDKPQQAKPKFYAKVEICGEFRSLVPPAELFPSVRIPATNPGVTGGVRVPREFVYWLDLSKLKGWDTKDRDAFTKQMRALKGHTVRIKGALTEVKFELSDKEWERPRLHVIVVESLEDFGE